MTTHNLTPKSSCHNHVIHVGWDSRHDTFFAHVYISGSARRDVLREGSHHGDYTNASDIVDLVVPYVDTTKVKLAKLTDALYRDQAKTPTTAASATTTW
ncbi:MAG TPA: hypothetical protein VGL46_09690 [Pseudonocardiaceae bacterium]|jgi:hypothetical protein